MWCARSNSCFDWGTFGGALRSGQVDASRYRHIVLINSSVRGPFLPPYWPVRPVSRTELSRERLLLCAAMRTLFCPDQGLISSRTKFIKR